MGCRSSEPQLELIEDFKYLRDIKHEKHGILRISCKELPSSLLSNLDPVAKVYLQEVEGY